MAIWVQQIKAKYGLPVRSIDDKRLLPGGCEKHALLAHYQGPKNQRCMWHKVQRGEDDYCCDDEDAKDGGDPKWDVEKNQELKKVQCADGKAWIAK